MFVLAPTNHLKNGALVSSRTVVQGSCQSINSLARSSQKPTKSASAVRARASQSLMYARSITPAEGLYHSSYWLSGPEAGPPPESGPTWAVGMADTFLLSA